MTSKVKFVCCECGGSNLVSDRPCKWDIEKQEWVLAGSVYDATYCEDCEEEVRVEVVAWRCDSSEFVSERS